MLVLSLTFISAANTITLDIPAASATVGGSLVLSASLDTNTLNITNASFFYRIGAGSWVTINNSVGNLTLTVFNVTFDTTSIVDVDDMTFNVSVHNSTSSDISQDVSASVTINNTSPSVTFSSSTFSNEDGYVSGRQFVVGTSTDSNGLDWCNVTVEGSSQIFAAAANACSSSAFSPSTFSLSAGTLYTLTMEVFDGNNDTTSITRSIYVDTGGGMTDVTDDDSTTPRDTSSGETKTNPVKAFFQSIADFFRRLFSRGN